MRDLDKALLKAHETGDSEALVTLYAMAAEQAEDAAAAGFYLTHAYIFALELGDARAPALHQRLKDTGREE
jgi:hypothetical protein